MKKNIFLGAGQYSFIRIPVNQQTFYDKFIKETSDEELAEWDLMDEDIQRFLAIENSKTSLFCDMATLDTNTNTLELPEGIIYHEMITDFNNSENKISLKVLQKNIKKVLSEFNEKEIYILEHLYGLNGVTRISADQIAKNLSVTKVNITFTKNRVIRMLRHSSLSNQLINGI